MDYRRSLRWLDELVAFGIKTGTGHTRIISGELGDPHLKFPSVLVGGTNGKGSTCSCLESILRHSGYRTGLFTSPHLVDIRERIAVGGEPIPGRLFAEAVSDVRMAYSRLEKRGSLDEKPTFFEALTLAAFRIFAKEKIDIAVVEVGMGGGKDCTNILEPVISVVTNASLDHQQYLGRTLDEIALEKAGIFRKGRPALIGKTSDRTEKILAGEAYRIGAEIRLMSAGKLTRKGGGFAFQKGKKELLFPKPFLPGKHQVDNTALAVLTARELGKLGFEIGADSVREGVQKCRWRGRLEKISSMPDVFLDGAHNIDGIRTLKRFVEGLSGKKVLVFSVMKDKPAEKMAGILAPFFEEIILTEIPMNRAAKREDLEELLEKDKYSFISEPMKALEKAKFSARNTGTVIVAGSLYLVGYILKNFEQREGTAWGTGL
ncbi:MAG TPA: folylpolyglutamate synthase/dihydrofolate synthase family protein [Acidobacteriota bacterium]|mgnify:FL=1|nr:folylpolyglutamate synthase/dihydrofolate synthase family protein [Acidobacteriota bacterium]HQO18849.1 folylpolyglutamate synthase/dihydrofolate synthase family protein [Acidobacteriota bacterium]HQQ47234.1 folylpolyglutamate synthase/dihydrofolate synthase family protein [Acidobacteriota bacterium]